MLNESFLAAGWDLSYETVSVTEWHTLVDHINLNETFLTAGWDLSHKRLSVTKWRSLVGCFKHNAQ